MQPVSGPLECGTQKGCGASAASRRAIIKESLAGALSVGAAPLTASAAVPAIHAAPNDAVLDSLAREILWCRSARQLDGSAVRSYSRTRTRAKETARSPSSGRSH
jgi:hypothetical protein